MFPVGHNEGVAPSKGKPMPFYDYHEERKVVHMGAGEVMITDTLTGRVAVYYHYQDQQKRRCHKPICDCWDVESAQKIVNALNR